ncbi:aspartate aminotransferase family protein [Micromonospora schwarzwaldensis]|uniref:aspartate aminotransferase family protein n=1 Tax=Micromonospora sp. DSM 45708 TaxID=3111767 RepID=UPI0031CDF741
MTGPRQRDLLAREAVHLAPGASEESALGGRVFTDGAGTVLTDADGNDYLDFAAGTLTQSLGHCHPEVVAALTAQAQRLWNVHDFATADRAELCELLAALLPAELDTYAFFSTGAEVVEAALRVVAAVAPAGRNRVGALRHGFHGKTQGARMLVHWDIGNQSLAGNSVLGYSPYCYRCPLDLEYPSCGVRCADLVRRHIADKPNISALVFEPVLGAAGVIVPPPGYWERIGDACRANGVLLVADEVLTGGGRTGTFLASEGLGIEPDLVTMAKGMASGFPFAVLAGRHEVLRQPETERAGSTASTFASNPLGISAALATLTVLRRDRLVDQVRVLGDVMADRLAVLHERHPVLGDVRGLGLLWGLEFVRDRTSRVADPQLAGNVYRRALDLGLRTALGGHILRLAPPFTLRPSELDRGLDLLDQAITEATEVGS